MEGSGNIASGGLATIVAASGVSATKTVTDAPTNTALLQALAAQGFVRGIVKSRGAQGTVTLATDLGALTLRTDVFLKRGAEVALKIEQRAAETLIRIVTVNGQSLGNYLESLDRAQPRPTQDQLSLQSSLLKDSASAQGAEASARPATPAASPQGIALRGVFLSPPQFDAQALQPMPALLRAQLPEAVAGTSLQIRLLAAHAPAPDSGGYISLSAAVSQAAASTPVAGYSAGGAATTQMPAQTQTQATHAGVQGLVYGGAAPSVPSAKGVLPTSYLTPSQRLMADPQIQAALQNMQAAEPEISALSLLSRATALQPDALSGRAAGAVQSGSTEAPASVASGATATGQGSTSVQTQLQPQASASTAPVATADASAAQPREAALAPATPSLYHAQALNARAPAPPTQPGSFRAVVIEASHPRELTLAAPFGTIKLFVTEPLPKGSLVDFTFEHAGMVRGGGAVTDAAGGSALPERVSPSLEMLSLLGSIRRAPPAEAAGFVPMHGVTTPPALHLVPRPGAALSAELLFLMSAISGGNLRSWLGEVLSRELEGNKEGRQMLARLSGEVASLRLTPVSEERSGQWQQLLIPVQVEGALHPIRFSYKRQRHGNTRTGQRDNDHFMVDVELTRLGRMQLDGLVQRHSGSMQFDLIVRTAREWESELQQSLRRIYLRAQEISGYSGTISFRHGQDAMMEIALPEGNSGAGEGHSILV